MPMYNRFGTIMPARKRLFLPMIADDQIVGADNRFEKIKASDNRILEDHDCPKKIKAGNDRR